MARKISISFKETTKDIELYNSIMAMEDKSCEIKKMLRTALEMENETVKKDNLNTEKEEIDILNF